MIHNGSASRLSLEGLLLATVPTAKNPEALAIAPLKLEPMVTIGTPADQTLTNNATPALILHFGANCSGTPCNFAPGEFGSYRLSAILNRDEIGTAFVFDALTARAAFTPPTRLLEGINQLQVQVTDSWGSASLLARSVFTVDTIAPTFTSTSPPDGSVTTATTAVVSGAVDEEATITISGNGVAASTSGRSFSFPVTLRQGPNVFDLIATDRAGNVATKSIRITLASGIQLVIASPGDGEVVTGSTLAVTGTFEGPVNSGITVNGMIAITVGNRFLATIPISTGPNQVAVTGRTPDGATTIQSLVVTSSGSTPIAVGLSPTAGIAPHTVSLTTPTIPDRETAQTLVDFDGNGTVDASLYGFGQTTSHTFFNPGIYLAQATINDFAGGRYQFTIPVVVQDVRELDRRLRAVVTGMLAKLQANDVQAAMTAFAPSSVQRYRKYFESIRDELPAIVPRLGDIVDGSITTRFAEYLMVRDAPDGKEAFLIYLVLGDDGVWRISQM